MATLLPNGKTQFLDSDGKPLAGGSVAFYTPGTTDFKDTYQDSAATILNINPVVLDASGEAVILGTGAYRQVVTDAAGNQIWDQETSEPGSQIDTVNVSGAITGGSISAGSLSVSGNVNVSGASGFTGPLTIGDALGVAASVTVGTSLEVAGSANFDGPTSINSLSVVGGATVAGNLGASNITASSTIGCTTLSTSGALSGSTTGWQLNPAGTGSFSGAYSLGIDSGAGVLGTTFIAASDARVKTDIEDVTLADSYRFLREMQAKVFLKDGSPDAGFIAQDAIVHGFQRMVVMSETDDPRMAVGDDVSPVGKRLNLNYNHATAYHHKMIDFLLDCVGSLQARVSALEGQKG